MRSCRFRSWILLFLLLLLPVTVYAQRIHYVDSAATGMDDGTSWSNAFSSLQDALGVAQDGDEIWVAAGTYRPDQGQSVTEGDREASFHLKPGVALYGGFAATETSREERDWTANETILSGDLLGNDNDNVDLEEPTRQDNSYHVVRATDLDPETVLDGFTITSGHAVIGGNSVTQIGGGLWIAFADQHFESLRPRVAHLVFEANVAAAGGAVFLDRIEGVDFAYVTFRNNVAEEGGGLYVSGRAFASGVAHSKKSARGGSSLRSDFPTLTLRQGAFIDNRAAVGGAMYFKGGYARLRQVTLQGNVAEAWAGGLEVDKAWLELWNGLFAGNRTLRLEGGALVTNEAVADLVNVVFTGNRAAQDGGACVNGASWLRLTNATFSNNQAGRRGGAIWSVRGDISPDFAMEASNTIFWGNTAAEEGQELYNSGPTRALLRHSLMAGGLPDGAEDGGGNRFADPLFVDADGADDVPGTLDDDVRLQIASPAVDAGDNEALPADSLDLDGDGDVLESLPVDLESRQRIFDGGSGMAVVDMGAYEFGAPLIDTATERPIPDYLPGIGMDIYPNPFRDRAMVQLTSSALPGATQITVRLFDPLGRLLRVIYNGPVDAGHTLHFAIEAAELPSGFYFLHVSNSTYTTAKGIVIEK